MSNDDQPDNRAESAAPSGRGGKASDDRQARLSKALRDNLRRRKAQVRARKAQDGEIGDPQANLPETMSDTHSDAQADKQETASGQEDQAAPSNQL